MSGLKQDALAEATAEFYLSRKNERICTRCQHPFWAWDTGKRKCYLCEPVTGEALRRAMGAGL